MPVELTSCTFSISGVATLQDGTLTIHAPTDPVQIGSGGFEELGFTLEDGTDDGQANQMYVARITVPAGGSVLLDLSDGSLLNFRGEEITLSAVKIVVVSVNEPDGVKRVYVGPLGEAGGAQLWFPGTGADAGNEVLYGVIQPNLLHGWPVGVTDGSILAIEAPDTTPGDIDVNVIIIGVQL